VNHSGTVYTGMVEHISSMLTVFILLLLYSLFECPSLYSLADSWLQYHG